MSFKRKKTFTQGMDSPESLFRDLRKRSVEGLLSHQADILREYMAQHYEDYNVAIELPTGSGKTLVGLLIAEYRRRMNEERVVYLCPTKQLVRQVVEQAEEKYGIKATEFTGSKKEYLTSNKSSYMTAETIAVTTYSSLFNTNPYFSSPQLIILDDAHAAENYIAKAWSLEIKSNEHKELFKGIIELFGDVFSGNKKDRLISGDLDPNDYGWVDKVPTPLLIDNLDSLVSFINEYVKNIELAFPWNFLSEKLHACNIYIGHDSILVRPYIPPSLSLDAFANASQRIFMSATLGAGGDLERITGVKNISRIKIPDGWDKQGIGRRFFLFPELGLEDENVSKLIIKTLDKSSRSLVLVPNDYVLNKFSEFVVDSIDTNIISSKDIEKSNKSFTESDNAVCVLANRYDGIDLAGEDCRILIIYGLPKHINLQERFMLTKMASSICLMDRIRTRIVQAVGRCTRSATDYAAVIILGSEIQEWFVLKDKREIFHPELQGEIQFGIDQSRSNDVNNYLDNLDIFLEHSDEWEDVDADILAYRDESQVKDIAEKDKLLEAAAREVEYQYKLWDQDYEGCAELANTIAEIYGGSNSLRGLRAIWFYYAASAYYMAWKYQEVETFKSRSEALFVKASSVAPSLSWLRSPSCIGYAKPGDDSVDILLNECVENIDTLFEKKNFSNPLSFEKFVKKIDEGINGSDPTAFENSHALLGELLGYKADNPKADSDPDPYWMLEDKICFVFEDKSNAKETTPIGTHYTTQVASQHPDWVKVNLGLSDDAKIIPIFVSPQSSIKQEAITYSKEARYWNINDFREWSANAIAVMRKLRGRYPGAGDIAWRADVSSLLASSNLDPNSLFDMLNGSYLRDLPTVK